MYSPNLNNKLCVQVVASMDSYHHRVSNPFTIVFILILGVQFGSHRMMVHVYWSDRACRKSKDHSHHQVGKARQREEARKTWLGKLLQVRKAPEAGTGQPALSHHPYTLSKQPIPRPLFSLPVLLAIQLLPTKRALLSSRFLPGHPFWHPFPTHI